MLDMLGCLNIKGTVKARDIDSLVAEMEETEIEGKKARKEALDSLVQGLAATKIEGQDDKQQSEGGTKIKDTGQPN
ncbi:uncharacterized protein DSM5745_04552 [Aspergillus mulundensis]|uniref:Uncharacterized protein n=1 Tax=Aspergillus mulundensis TaxID=1810919 RepID=A0A3D8SD08_9EURO|nr:hypothetical protein DSM5745_04552 [Aspergillus mulundensis]RDW84226.1 hypothetical protein DSM5745_04552 [Aspergillus mulundensis]